MFLKLDFIAPFLIASFLASSALSQEITETSVSKSRLDSCGDTCAHVSIGNSTATAQAFQLRIAGGLWSRRSLFPGETKDFSVSLPVREIAGVRFQVMLTQDQEDAMTLVPGTNYVFVAGPQKNSPIFQPETP